MKVWQLNKDADRKVRSSHPWIFSNDLAHSPKGIEPGEPIELRDAAGQFVALGYGNPHSLICFRKLSSDPSESDIFTSEFFTRKLRAAAQLRERAGLAKYSYRLCFAEADGVPGLIVDRFQTVNGQVFVVQSSTAGIDRALPEVLAAVTALAGDTPTSIVISNTSQSRTMEQLPVEERRIHLAAPGFRLGRDEMYVAADDGSALPFQVDFAGGQKTGFFLDQHFNVTLTTRLCRDYVTPLARVRVLDLCCYVGQWSVHLAHLMRSLHKQSEFTLVDASAAALELALANVQRQEAMAQIQKLDVLDGLQRLPESAYDVVICDPPAFIKRKKDFANGRAGYVKLNREALKRVAPGGLLVTCSCSGALSESDFHQALQVAVAKSGRQVKWILRGSQSPDHPVRLEFPEGQYLKCLIGIVE